MRAGYRACMPYVTVVPYDPAWPDTFRGLRDRVTPALEGIADRIEHIGSTSVPGLWAKPVIDMTVVVPSIDDVPRAIDALAPLGYAHRGDLGIVGREAFTRPDGLPAHNLYVCAKGALALRNHFALRDHLRAHEPDREAYSALKRELASAHPDDIDRYTVAKSDLLLRLLEAAGLSREDLDTIRRQNS